MPYNRQLYYSNSLREFPQLMSHGPGASSSVTSTSGTGPTSPSSILFTSTSGSAQGGYSEASLFHLHICFNGTAAPPGAPILDDRQTKKGSMSELIRRLRKKLQQCWGCGILGKKEEKSAEKSRKWEVQICLPTEWAKKLLAVVCEKKSRTDYFAPAHHTGHWGFTWGPKEWLSVIPPRPQAVFKEQVE